MKGNRIQLSERLQAVTAMVPECGCVADVGCDHGYISIFLVQSGTARRAIAMDIRKGPLLRAQEHIQEQQLASYIQVRLSDGLEQLRPGEADVIVIAGMGGATMSRILMQGRHLLTEQVTLVLQPQSELMEFRSFLVSEGLVITREELVLEDGKYYPMMQVRAACARDNTREQPGEGQVRAACARDSAGEQPGEGKPVYEKEELMFGPLLLKQRHPLLRQYLIWRQEQVLRIRSEVEAHAAGEARPGRLAELEEELMLIGRGLSVYQQDVREQCRNKEENTYGL